MVSLLVVFILVMAACQGGGGEPVVSTPAAETEAAEPTEAPATEETEGEAEPTEAPAEEEAAETPATEEEAAETPAAEEEAAAEGTPAAEEEAEATDTPAAEEEDAEATETPAAEEEASLSPEAEAGQYLVTVARGCGCHFNGDLGGYAGGGFAFELGEGTTIYPANLTPHEETGIGTWAPEEIATAIRTGATPDGEQLHPVMPYRAFSHLSDEDALNIAAYLLAQEPIENAIPERVLAAEPEAFTPEEGPPATAPADPVERGEYLVRLARCGDCHTPRNEDGSQNMDMFLAGNRINEDEIAWNITPDEATGLGSIPQEEIAHFLRTGEYADGSQVAGTMMTQIERYFSHLTEEDAMAIAAFLKSIPAIENDPE
jgi:cytochrome c553